MVIIGSARSGKTSMMVNLLTSTQAYKKAFHNIHIVMLSHSVAGLKNNVFKNHPRMHDELKWSVLDGILESVKEDAEEKYNSLLILEDVTASLKDKSLQQLLKKTIYNRRHYRLSITILVLSYNAMPLSIRKTLSHFLSYKPRNKKEFTAIFEELIFLDREQGEALTKFVFDKPYQFIFSDVNSNQLYKKIVRIIVKDAGQEGQSQKGKE
jgi:hypothetical protein